jgi:nucleoside-diphosphate-sugar epimerase
MARVTVLGAGGFIGRAVRRAFMGSHHEILCVDRAAGSAGPGERWQVLDLTTATDRELLGVSGATDAQAVVNCAGLLEGPLDDLTRANFLLPARLVEAVGSATRLVHIGSSAEYGASELGAAVGEDDPTRPVSTYAISKLAGSLVVAAASRARSVDCVVLRLFNPLGPGMPSSSMPGRAIELIRRAQKEGSTSIRMGPLDTWRDFIDLRDAAAAIVAVALATELSDPILNVGTGSASQARSVVQALAAAAAWRGEVVEDEALSSPRSLGVSWQQADTARIRAIGWEPRYRLPETALEMVVSAA